MTKQALITRAVDVLVVGLGPAGSRAAAEAAGAGRSVLAIDRRKRAGHPVQCAEYVPAMLGQELGSLAPLTRQRIGTMITFVEDDAPDLTGNFPGLMIERAEFDRTLVARATATGAECRFGVHLKAFTEQGVAHLSNGQSISAGVVIGADGPRSRVGGGIGHVNRELVETRQITVPLLSPHNATDIFLSADIAGGYGWLFPKDTVANLGVGVVPKARARLKPLLNRLHGTLAGEGRVGCETLGLTGGPIPVGGMVEPTGHLGGVPVLLAGDAAGLTNPVTGAGIASAVISGQMAGRAAADWLDGNGVALDDYSCELAALFTGTLGRAIRRRREILASYETGNGPTPAVLRQGWIAYPQFWAA